MSTVLQVWRLLSVLSIGLAAVSCNSAPPCGTRLEKDVLLDAAVLDWDETRVCRSCITVFEHGPNGTACQFLGFDGGVPTLKCFGFYNCEN